MPETVGILAASPASAGGASLGFNNFTDTDGIAKSVSYSQIVFGHDSVPPTLVTATVGLPVIGSVTNTVAVSGTFWQTTQPVSGTITANQGGAPWSTTVAGTPTVSLGASTVPVSGTFWQATQPISGTVTANAGSGTMTVNPGNTANTTPWLISGTVTANAGSGTFNASLGSATVAVSQAGIWNVTSTISGTPTFSLGASTIPVSQAGVWTVTANAGTNLNTSLLALESGGNLATLAGGVAASIYQENVKQVGGNAIAVGSGTTTTGTQRVVVAADDTISVSAAQSGVWNIGSLTSLTNALPSGSNTVGSVSIAALGNAVSLGSSTVNVAIVSGGGSGGTASNFSSAFPATGTAIGGSDTAGNMSALQLDGNKFLKVNVAAGSAGNGAASNTGSAVPAQADYAGLNVSGTLRGWTGSNPGGTIYSGQVDLTAVGGSTIGTTVPVSGTLTANAGSGTFTVNPGNTANTTPWLTQLAAGSAVVGSVSIAAGQTLTANAGSGTFTVNPGNTQNTTPWLATISGALPTGSNTIGSVSIAALGNAVTLSGTPTVNAQQSGSWNVALNGGSNVIGSVSIAAGQSITANAGTNLNTSLLALEAGGNLATLAGGVAASVYQENLKQVGGNAVAVGSGTTTTGCQRVVVASDETIAVNAAQAGTWNIGTLTSLSNALPAGSNTIGSVSIAPLGNLVSLGTATVTVNPGNTANTTAWLVTNAAGSAAIGSVSINAASANGHTPFKFLPGSGTNTFTVKGSAGNLVLLDLNNGSASPAFVHLFNSGTPTIGSGSASMAFFIPAGGGHVIPITPPGITFTSAIGLTVTGGSLADSDTVALNGSNSICVTGAYL